MAESGEEKQSTSGEGRWTRATAIVTAFTAPAALVFTAQSLRATRDQIGVTEQGQLTDRFTKPSTSSAPRGGTACGCASRPTPRATSGLWSRS